MRAVLLSVLCLVFGCSRTLHTFQVEAPGAVSAELQLCERAAPLKRSGAMFTITHGSCGDASGWVDVRYANRAPVRCRIGYVTTGMTDTWTFKVDGDQCHLLDVKRR